MAATITTTDGTKVQVGDRVTTKLPIDGHDGRGEVVKITRHGSVVIEDSQLRTITVGPYMVTRI